MSPIKSDVLYLSGLLPNRSGGKDILFVPIRCVHTLEHSDIDGFSGVLITDIYNKSFLIPFEHFTSLSISLVDPLCNIYTAEIDFKILESIPYYYSFDYDY